MPEVKRTLVKSGPELWAEISDPAALARHLGPFGSVRITRTEDERLLAWEGDRARGEVLLEASGFGTRVVLTAMAIGAAQQPEPEPAPPQPDPVAEEVRQGFWARLFRRRPEEAPAPPPPEPVQTGPPPEPAPAAPALDLEAVLNEMLDALGTAHHRPFSRA